MSSIFNSFLIVSPQHGHLDLLIDLQQRFYHHIIRVIISPGGGTLGISGWGRAAGTLEPLTYNRASSAEFCYPILE